MKECTQIEKHNTCQSRAWNGDKSRLLCTSYGCLCGYRSDFIKFEDIADDTVMFCGDIERTYEFKTKAEWIAEYDGVFPVAEFEDDWHTATERVADIDLRDLINDIEESGEMYEDWYSNVLPACEDDEVVLAGIKRLNEIMSKYPTYYEDQKVVFEEDKIE